MSRRLALKSNVVSYSVARRSCAKYGVIWSRGAWCSFSNVVSDGIQRFICARYGALWGIAALGVCFPASCSKVSRGSPMLSMTCSAASRHSPSVFHRRFHFHADSHLRYMWLLFEASRWLASRRCSSDCQHRAISLQEAFLGLVWCSVSESQREASQRSASICQRLVLCRH
jgi:hypothetical protein